MLQIRLSNKGSASESGGGAKLPSGETVTVACPDHLILAELPVAKSLGLASGVTRVQTVGRRSRRPLGERVHFCVQCDFPIAIYGRLSPCEHAFCLDCARSDSICYLCDERIQKIQTIKMMEGIFICAAPHCLKSFLKKTDFESHVHNVHADLVHPAAPESEPTTAKKPPSSESTVQPPTPRPTPPPPQDHEERTSWHQPPPLRPLAHPNPTPPRADTTTRHHPGPDGPATMHPEYPVGQYGGPSAPEGGMDHGSLLGYPKPWNGGPMAANQGGFDQGRYFSPPGNAGEGRGGLAAPRPLPPPPLPLPLPPPQQFVPPQGGFYGSGDGLSYGWPQDKHQHDGYGNGMD